MTRSIADFAEGDFVGRFDHAMFRDDRGDQFRGRDVERGVVDIASMGRGGAPQALGDLAAVALLDGDLPAGGEREIDAAGRGGDVERNAKMPGEDGDAEGADFV